MGGGGGETTWNPRRGAESGGVPWLCWGLLYVQVHVDDSQDHSFCRWNTECLSLMNVSTTMASQTQAGTKYYRMLSDHDSQTRGAICKLLAWLEL